MVNFKLLKDMENEKAQDFARMKELSKYLDAEITRDCDDWYDYQLAPGRNYNSEQDRLWIEELNELCLRVPAGYLEGE